MHAHRLEPHRARQDSGRNHPAMPFVHPIKVADRDNNLCVNPLWELSKERHPTVVVLEK